MVLDYAIFITQNKAGHIGPGGGKGDEEPHHHVTIIIPDKPTADSKDHL